MRFDSLQLWLDWLKQLHPKVIDLGLSRCAEVAQSLAIKAPNNGLITVAGTNGKGSTVAYYETALQQLGYSTGAFTSPALSRYNEQIRINGVEVDDQTIIAAFAEIDQVRGETSLSYFEFGTLAAMWIMQQQAVDYWILEVGLGGRLDAVNILDADLAHINMIGLDHQHWLGETRAEIALEKGGILRAAQKSVYNDPDPVPELLQFMQQLESQSLVLGQDYFCDERPDGFYFRLAPLASEQAFELPPQQLEGRHQAQNLCGVLAGLTQLFDKPVDFKALIPALAQTRVSGRLQWLRRNQTQQILLDVGHNPAAAEVIQAYLRQHGVAEHSLTLVLGMLEDKDIVGFVRPLLSLIKQVSLVQLDTERAMNTAEMRSRLEQLERFEDHNMLEFDSVAAALESLHSKDQSQGLILVCGSFYTVEAALRWQG